MVTKKLSAVDRLTLATGAVEKINDEITKIQNESEKSIELSLKNNKKYNEDLKTAEQLAEEIKKINSEIKNLEVSLEVKKGQWRGLTNDSMYAYNMESRLKDTETMVKNKFVSEIMKEQGIKKSLAEHTIKSLINKGQSLALLSENQDPSFVDNMLMVELKKQI